LEYYQWFLFILKVNYMQLFASFLLKILGWNITNKIPSSIKKAVIIVAPHTSLWDTPIGRISFWHMGINTKILIKKEAFIGPFGSLLKVLGGIPVTRSKSTKLTETVANMFNESDSLFITITPEGTRSLVKEWKLGFYYIALAADVPIILGVLDYKNKQGGMMKLYYPTGNIEKDLPEIQSFYKGIEGKNPHRSKIFD